MRSRTVCGRLHRPQPRTCMTSAQKVVSQDCRQLAHRAARQIWQTARFASAVTCQVTATNVAQPLCQMSWALYVGYRLPQLLKDDLNLSADVLTACREESILDSRAGYGGAVPSGGEVQRHAPRLPVDLQLDLGQAPLGRVPGCTKYKPRDLTYARLDPRRGLHGQEDYARPWLGHAVS